MRKENKMHIQFRYAVMSVLILLFAGGITYKLFSTTVIHAKDWNEMAKKEFNKLDTVRPERGDILADDGSILATNMRYYTMRIDFRAERFQEDTYRQKLDSIALLFSCHFPSKTEKQWREHFEQPLKKEPKKRSRSWKVMSRLSHSDVQLIKTFPFFNITNKNKNGVHIQTENRRTNPYGAMAKRSVGGVGETVNKEIHGVSGLERALDSLLYGVPGLNRRIPLTHHIGRWVETPAIPGYNLRTTINIAMQDIVENELNRVLDSCSAEWGCAILMDVKTGDIKAISNLQRNTRGGGGYLEALNYAVVGFEPGSVVKPISMMIALEDGIVNNLEEVIPIGASWAYAGGPAITDSHYNSSLRVREVIEQSSNIGMARIITRHYHSDPAAFVNRLEEIGFLEPLNTGIAGETTPYFRRDPGRVDLSRMCYGYASKIPPIYTLSIYNAIANGGKYVRPRLVSALHTENFDSIIPVSYVRDRICSEENAKKMQYMLKQVVWGDHGTGRSLKNDRVALAGKTGTCYSVDPVSRRYDRARKRLAFCGFFPADDPQYSCMVLTFWPKRNMFGAASTSGQVMKNIALKMYARGMLGNSSNFAENTPEQVPRAQFYGSLDPDRHSKMRKAARIEQEVHPATPRKMPEGTVPGVAGLGLREAVVTLEKQGYEVTFSGTGYVRSQTPSEGSLLAKGGKVNLHLAP